MKKLLLIIVVLLFCGNAFSQDLSKNEISIAIDKTIENLDQSQITSGILLNRSANWSSLNKVNLSEKSINYNYFKQALLDLHMASNREKFISSQSLKDYIKKRRLPDNTVYIGIISASFERLNYDESDSTKSGLILEENKFKSKPNKSSFLHESSLIASPLRIAAKGKTITYKFNYDLWFNNSDKELVSLDVNFGENKTYNVIKNSVIIVKEIQQSYTKTGNKMISFTATYSDGSKNSIDSKIYIIAEEIISSQAAKVTNDFIIANEPFNGALGRMDYRIYFRTNDGSNPSLKKPIIIIDGFDPGDKRRITDSDCASDPDCVSQYNGYFSNQEHLSIWEFNEYEDANNNTINFITELRSRGFDVVIVNNPTHETGNQNEIDGGADYIERNGLTLVALIKRLNSILESNGKQMTTKTLDTRHNKLVIVGPSMGGQISRYALAYMEKKYNQTNNTDWKHNTRLWISIDSPHLGANIPIGLQAVVHQLAGFGLENALDFRDDQLGSAAAKQQLIEQYNGRNGNQLDQTKLNARTVSQGYSTNRGEPFFRNYYDNLFNNGLSGSDGYPQNVRKIALTNGSLTNSKQYPTDFITYLPGGSYAGHGQRTLNIRGFADIPFTTHIFSLETYFKKNTGGNGKISRLKLGPSIGNLDQSLYLTNNNSRGNMDNVSGGWFAGQHDLNKSTIREGLMYEGIQVGYLEERELRPAHSFISTFSAIAHNDPDRSWNQKLDKNLVCQNLTPFDSYFGQDKNSRHTSFNADSAIWLLDEIEGHHQEPFFPVNPDCLVGESKICRDEVKTYTFSSCSTPGDVVEWNKSPNLQLISSNANSITVKPPADNRASGWIRATFENGVEVQKDIWIGKPSSPTHISGPTEVNTGALVTYRGYGGAGLTDYEWWLPHPFDVVNPIDYFADNWQVRPNQNRIQQVFTGYSQNDGYVQFMGRNRCGAGGAALLWVEHGNGGPGGGGIPKTIQATDDITEDLNNTIKVHPNPANDFITISINQEELNKYIKVLLFDSLGRLITDRNFVGEDLKIDTSKLANGLYLLKVFSDTNSITKKIIIEH